VTGHFWASPHMALRLRAQLLAQGGERLGWRPFAPLGAGLQPPLLTAGMFEQLRAVVAGSGGSEGVWGRPAELSDYV